MTVAFRVKLFTGGCHRKLSRRLSTLAVRAGVWREEEQVAGELLFRWFASSCFVFFFFGGGVVCVFCVCRGGLCLLCLLGWLVSTVFVGVACVFYICWGGLCLLSCRDGLCLLCVSGWLVIYVSGWLVSSVFVGGGLCLLCCRGGLCLLVCWGGLRLLCVSSLGQLDDRPRARLKASTPHEAPIPALTTKTLIPTAANRRSTRTEATRTAPAFKTAAKREDCVVLEAPHQHRQATSHPSSQVVAWALHCCDSKR